MLQQQFGVPGQTNAVFTQTNEFIWGGDPSKIMILQKSCVIDGSARDAGHTSNTTVLRPGLILGKITATGKIVEWDSGAVDGSETVYGILPVELVMVDPVSGSDADKVAPVVVWAPVKAKALRIKGATMVGDGDEAAARTGLNAKRFMLDDEY